MFDNNFSDASQQVLAFADEEARIRDSNDVECSHVLLGILRVDGVGAQALQALGASYESVRDHSDEIVRLGIGSVKTFLPPSPRLERVLSLSLVHARRDGYAHIEPVYLLLGLLDDGDNSAVRALNKLGLTRDQVEQAVSDMLPCHIALQRTSKPASREASRGGLQEDTDVDRMEIEKMIMAAMPHADVPQLYAALQLLKTKRRVQ